MPNIQLIRDRVFISYSHADAVWLKELRKHLKNYVVSDTVSVWDDTLIKTGDDWFQEIQRALSVTKVAVLLVTPDFLDSKFIAEHEATAVQQAFQSEGLRVVWIAITASGYKKTWLAKHQAANNPEKPLDLLSKGEQAQEFVKICEKIEEALNGPVAGPATPQVKTSPRYEIIRCDRGRYLNRVRSLFNEGLKERPWLPQAYLILGKVGQCHDTFVERIYREVLKPHVDRESAGSPQKGILHKNVGVSWPDALDDVARQQEDLQIALSEEYAGQPPSDWPATFPPKDFASLPQFSNYRFVTVQHEIHLEGLANADWLSVREVLRWYLQSYWAEVARTVTTATSERAQTQFLLFLKIIYGTQGLIGKVLQFSKGTFDKEAVKTDLEQIASQTDDLFPCIALPELETPKSPEVLRWYAEQNIFDNEQDRLDAVSALYQKHGEQLTMAIIERDLQNRVAQPELLRGVA